MKKSEKICCLDIDIPENTCDNIAKRMEKPFRKSALKR